jgi:hypothetical protein
VKPFKVRLRFHGDLSVFLRSKAGDAVIERRLAETTSIKDVIESWGVPHPEVDLILVDEQTVGFDHTVANDAKVEVSRSKIVTRIERRNDYKQLEFQDLWLMSIWEASREIFVCSDLMSPTVKMLTTANCSK